MVERFDVNFVAHTDDDIVYMQPDIYYSYRAGRGQVGVALTAVTNIYWNDMAHARRLESGAMDASAQMGLLKAQQAGAQSGTVRWRISTAMHAGFPVTTADCIDYPDLRWIFLRLPGAPSKANEAWHLDFAGHDPGTPFPRLQDLWSGSVQTLAPADSGTTGLALSKDHVIEILTSILTAYRPQHVRVTDFRTQPSGDAASLDYDHQDHYYTGLFAREAIRRYAQATPGDTQFWVYRGYNTASRPRNLQQSDRDNKAWCLYYLSLNIPEFGAFDRALGITENDQDNTKSQWQNQIYAQWLWRQYSDQFTPDQPGDRHA